MNLQAIIDSYGYPALLVGTFLEGETILVMGGIAAKLGYLHLPWVILSGFSGSLLGDQFLFFLGRLRGQDVLERFPRWKSRAEVILPRVERHRLLLIMGFRFIYGMRTVTPFVLGMSRVPIMLFVFLNTLSAALWSLMIGGLGFLFGHGIELLLGDIHHYESELFAGILFVAVVLLLIHRFVDRQ